MNKTTPAADGSRHFARTPMLRNYIIAKDDGMWDKIWFRISCVMIGLALIQTLVICNAHKGNEDNRSFYSAQSAIAEYENCVRFLREPAVCKVRLYERMPIEYSGRIPER